MKTFTLYKRAADSSRLAADADGFRDRPYYFTFQFRSQAHTRCLETNDATEAQRRARLKATEIRNAIIAGEYDRLDGTKTRHAVHATLGDLFSAYRTSPVIASGKTRESNLRAMLNLVGRTSASGSDPARLLQTPFPKLVNGDTAEAWFKLDGIEPQTANSLWRQAASLCAPRALFSYKKLKIFHACLEEFVSSGSVCQRQVSKARPRPPSDDIIDATLRAWENIEDRNLFLAIGHELAFGLRAGEVAQADWNWWAVKYGSPMLCATGAFKHNHEGYFELTALDPFYTLMRNKAIARGWYHSSGPIITGSPTYRRDGIQREASLFLRGQGWETKKTNHALRAYAGGLVCLKYGVYRAKEFLRHSSVKVTEQHYLYLLKHPLVDAIREACPAKWATVEPAPFVATVIAASA